MSNKELIVSSANEMLETFKTHSTKVQVAVRGEEVEGVAQAWVSDEGLKALGDIFELVPLGLRAAVMEVFLDKLVEQGYAYNIEQFKGTVH